MERSRELPVRTNRTSNVRPREIPKLRKAPSVEQKTQNKSRELPPVSVMPLSKKPSLDSLPQGVPLLARKPSSNNLKPALVVAAKPSLDKMPESDGRMVPSDFPTAMYNEKNIDKMVMELAGKALINCNWYHGLMPRTECECMLKNDGDFVLRKTTLKKFSCFCLSVMYSNPKHFPIEYKKCAWTLHQTSAGTLPELVEKLLKNAISIGTSGAVLKNPIPKPEFYLLHENITTDKKLGAGAFGEVYTGILKQKGGVDIPVAVKMIKGQVQKNKLTEFVKEAKLMRRFCHPNCVRLWGVAPQEEPLMIVLEICPGGSLKSWFKNHLMDKNLDKQQVIFMQDAARGMCYLSLSNVIHRDLAARNCLLGKNNELKISDFGLSVADKTELVLDKLKAVPVKWLAPETLQKGVFTTKTDVWSYGVLIWEIFVKCKTDPFPNMTNGQAKDLILGEKPPLTPPPESPPLVQQVFDVCFVKAPQNRADFVQLLKLVAPEEKPPSIEKAPE